MPVKELIQQLSKLDQSLPVYIENTGIGTLSQLGYCWEEKLHGQTFDIIIVVCSSVNGYIRR